MDSTRQPIVLELVGRITPADVPLLCARLRRRTTGDCAGREVVCDAARLAVADLTAVEAVARLRLTARRLGRELRLANAGPELLTLLALAGLGDDGPDRPSPVSPRR
ncbi:STAS domain-containing protein [Streptomyces sp. HNM0645]|uniref:STAS domain-containing protein n=1 Tax=Streptomyces sp. HNM0645 TaxID=2782343 RepID=UPI0024B86578|nr:STAS domain-containing protein [Streptomyces sp. HNM0645]MDI9887809.1 STAS domain-containing protein [Streptomyces sp. HNM0645]